MVLVSFFSVYTETDARCWWYYLGDVCSIFLVNHLALSRRARLPLPLLHDHLRLFLFIGPCHLLLRFILAYIVDWLGFSSEQPDANHTKSTTLSFLILPTVEAQVLSLFAIPSVGINRGQEADRSAIISCIGFYFLKIPCYFGLFVGAFVTVTV